MLLSRTADSMYWMARYIERAESVARLLDVGRRMSSLVPDPDDASSEWTSTIEAAGCEASFAETHGTPTASNVIDHLVRDVRNPSSIFACLATVRQNARAVRTALAELPDGEGEAEGFLDDDGRGGPPTRIHVRLEKRRDRLAIDLINGSELLRRWVDDPEASPADLDALTEPDEAAWRAAREPFLLYR